LDPTRLTFLDPTRLTFLEDRTFRTLGEDLTLRGDLEADRLTFTLVDFLARGIFNITGKNKKNIFFYFQDLDLSFRPF